MALFDSTITFHAQYQQRHDIPALLDLLVLDRDNPRSLGWVAQTLRGRLAKLAGSAPGEVPDIALSVPDPQQWTLEALCERDADGRYTRAAGAAAAVHGRGLPALGRPERALLHAFDRRAPQRRRVKQSAMLLHVIHETRYDYAPPVKTAQHMAHLQPAHTATAALAEPPARDQPGARRSKAKRPTSTATRAPSSACAPRTTTLKVVAHSLVETSRAGAGAQSAVMGGGARAPALPPRRAATIRPPNSSSPRRTCRAIPTSWPMRSPASRRAGRCWKRRTT